MAYKRYKMLQMYVDGVPQEKYKQGDLIDSTEYGTLADCNEGNQNPNQDIDGNIYQWVSTSDTMCTGVNKYKVEKRQVSIDFGVTWEDTGETRQGDLLQTNSPDCQ